MAISAPVLRLRLVAPSSAYQRFCADRKRALASFSAWISDPHDRPSDADVAIEAQGTGAAITQLCELVGRRPE